MSQTIESDVLVLGGGFAGVWCARRAMARLPRGATVTLVSAENYFVFQPLLPEVVGASIEPEHVISPVRQLLPGVQVLRGDVVGFREEDGSVEVRVPELQQDLRCRGTHTVFALGSVVDVSRIPGMAEHAFMMKGLADALRLRHALMERLELAVLTTDPELRAALMTFVVAGGGFSGLETAAEMLDALRHATRFYPSLSDTPIRVVCIHSGERLIPEMDPRLGAFALRSVRKRGMEVRLGARVRAVSPQMVHLEDGEVIATHTVVCTVGNAPHPVVTSLGADLHRGRIVTDEYLRVPGSSNIWAVGDGAHSPDGHGGIAPPTAQFATRQGECVAENIARVQKGKALVPFRHKSQGQLATLGHRNAVAFVGKLPISGFLAWWMWRTIYLMKLPRLHRKLQVVLDWTLALFFPRSTNVIDTRSTEPMRRVHLEAGETLFRQGDPSSAFYILESGQMQLSQVDPQGGTELVEALEAGDHFGEGSLLHRRIRSTTAVAKTPCSILVIGEPAFDAMADTWRMLRHDVLEATSHRFKTRAESLPLAIPEAVLEQKCGDLMSAPAKTLDHRASIEQAMAMMIEQSFSSLPLVDGEGQLRGLVTRTDLYRAVHRDLDLSQDVASISTREPRVVRIDEPVSRAVELMRRRGLKHAPVLFEDGRVAGVISFLDIMREALSERMGREKPVGAN